jgi:hypothetical protein
MDFGDFRKLEFPDAEPVIFGLYPGELGMVQAKPNVGKTTMMLNLALSAAAGRAFPPLLKEGEPKKVLYMDFENRAAFLQKDLMHMVDRNLEEAEHDRADNNFNVLVDCFPYDFQLNLVRPQDMKFVTQLALSATIELIIIDTLAQAFGLLDENNNSEMQRVVISPLQTLARTTGASVLLVHHIGKGGDNGDPSKLYRGRGASSLAGACRLILDLDHMKDAERNPVKDTVVLTSPKVKGPAMKDSVFRLKFEDRWFELMNAEVAGREALTDQIIGLVSRGMKRGEVIGLGRAEGIVSDDRTFDRALRFGLDAGLLQKGPRATYAPTALWHEQHGEKEPKEHNPFQAEWEQTETPKGDNVIPLVSRQEEDEEELSEVAA